MFPEYANINGKRYKLNTDFRVGLRCFEVIEDETICAVENGVITGLESGETTMLISVKNGSVDEIRVDVYVD